MEKTSFIAYINDNQKGGEFFRENYPYYVLFSEETKNVQLKNRDHKEIISLEYEEKIKDIIKKVKEVSENIKLGDFQKDNNAIALYQDNTCPYKQTKEEQSYLDDFLFNSYKENLYQIANACDCSDALADCIVETMGSPGGQKSKIYMNNYNPINKTSLLHTNYNIDDLYQKINNKETIEVQYKQYKINCNIGFDKIVKLSGVIYNSTSYIEMNYEEKDLLEIIKNQTDVIYL